MSLKNDIKKIAKEFEAGMRHNAEGTLYQIGTESDEGLQHNETKRIATQFEQKLKQAAAAKPTPAVGKLKPAVRFQAPKPAPIPKFAAKPVAVSFQQMQEEADRDLAIALQMQEDPNFRPGF